MRKPRRLKKGASYHVIGRINRDESIFKSDLIKNLFLSVIRDAKKKYNFSLKNFCILEDCIHFIIEPLKEENLSKIMQWILSVFAIRYNRKFKIRGHVWYDRFISKVIDNIKQLVEVSEYINRIPIVSNLAKKPGEYQFCGLFHIFRNSFDIITNDKILLT
jgi:putative transposase